MTELNLFQRLCKILSRPLEYFEELLRTSRIFSRGLWRASAYWIYSVIKENRHYIVGKIRFWSFKWVKLHFCRYISSWDTTHNVKISFCKFCKIYYWQLVLGRTRKKSNPNISNLAKSNSFELELCHFTKSRTRSNSNFTKVEPNPNGFEFVPSVGTNLDKKIICSSSWHI